MAPTHRTDCEDERLRSVYVNMRVTSAKFTVSVHYAFTVKICEAARSTA